ncbi:hypothetical protein BGZ88_005573 [Linnemannia elongata]|nr:hypothetical protein BGZ88_005573 [Linnemannia elongata]
MVQRLDNTLALMKQTSAQLQYLHTMAAPSLARAAVRNTMLQRLLNDHGALQRLLDENLPTVYHELLNIGAFEVAQQLASQMEWDTSA